MTQIDLSVDAIQRAMDTLNEANDCFQPETLDELRKYFPLLGEAVDRLKQSQATPTDDLVLCRRVVKGDTTKYYDYVPVDTDKVEAKATTSDYAMSSLPLEIKQKIWSDAAKVEVQVPEAGTWPDTIRAQLPPKGKTVGLWHPWAEGHTVEYTRSDLVQRPSGDDDAFNSMNDFRLQEISVLESLLLEAYEQLEKCGIDGTMKEREYVLEKLKERLDK